MIFQFAMLNNQMVKLSRHIQSQHNPTIIHKIQPDSTKIPTKTSFCGLIPPSYDTWADLHKIIRSSPTLHQQYQRGTLVVRVYIYQLCTEHLRCKAPMLGCKILVIGTIGTGRERPSYALLLYKPIWLKAFDIYIIYSIYIYTVYINILYP